jgi:phosphoribosylformylglycinamidine synthase I
MATPQALILRSPGANCDVETQFALEKAGAFAERVHINRVRENPKMLDDYQILVIPGGFTYGDDAGSGKIVAVQLRHYLEDAIRRFRDQEKLILGICNGFQILLKAGLILQPDDEGPHATLTHNAEGKFEDRWVHLAVYSQKSPFLQGYERLYLPVAHGEGRLVCRDRWILQGLQQTGQLVLHYVDEQGQRAGYPFNPNGSEDNVAGICDLTGRVFGLMPHPERHVLPTQHPRWTREGLAAEGEGLRLFRNAVEYFR